MTRIARSDVSRVRSPRRHDRFGDGGLEYPQRRSCARRDRLVVSRHVLPRLELQPITRTEFDRLVGAVLDGHVERATLERLWAIAAGNVLYVRELIFDAVEAGTLALERGRAVAMDGARGNSAPTPGSCVQSHRRAPRRPASPARLLPVAEPLGLDLVEQLAPAASLADAERRGLINIEVTGRRTEVRLGHPLFAEALLLALPAATRRHLYRGLADRSRRRARTAMEITCGWRYGASKLATSPTPSS